MDISKLVRLWKKIGPGATRQKDLIKSLSSNPLNESEAKAALKQLQEAAREITPNKKLGDARLNYVKLGKNPNAFVNLERRMEIENFFDPTSPVNVIDYPEITVLGDKINKATLAHELGHAYTHLKHGDKRLPTITSVGSWLKGTKYLKEEMKASAKGLRMLKASGSSAAEIEEARKQLKQALDSYRTQRFATTLISGGNELFVSAVLARRILGKKDK